jgi:hypothetical protein
MWKRHLAVLSLWRTFCDSKNYPWTVLSCLFCPVYLVLAVFSWHFGPGCLVLAVLSRLSFSGCHCFCRKMKFLAETVTLLYIFRDGTAAQITNYFCKEFLVVCQFEVKTFLWNVNCPEV